MPNVHKILKGKGNGNVGCLPCIYRVDLVYFNCIKIIKTGCCGRKAAVMAAEVNNGLVPEAGNFRG